MECTQSSFFLEKLNLNKFISEPSLDSVPMQ